MSDILDLIGLISNTGLSVYESSNKLRATALANEAANERQDAQIAFKMTENAKNRAYNQYMYQLEEADSYRVKILDKGFKLPDEVITSNGVDMINAGMDELLSGIETQSNRLSKYAEMMNNFNEVIDLAGKTENLVQAKIKTGSYQNDFMMDGNWVDQGDGTYAPQEGSELELALNKLDPTMAESLRTDENMRIAWNKGLRSELEAMKLASTVANILNTEDLVDHREKDYALKLNKEKKNNMPGPIDRGEDAYMAKANTYAKNMAKYGPSTVRMLTDENYDIWQPEIQHGWEEGHYNPDIALHNKQQSASVIRAIAMGTGNEGLIRQAQGGDLRELAMTLAHNLHPDTRDPDVIREQFPEWFEGIDMAGWQNWFHESDDEKLMGTSLGFATVNALYHASDMYLASDARMIIDSMPIVEPEEPNYIVADPVFSNRWEKITNRR